MTEDISGFLAKAREDGQTEFKREAVRDIAKEVAAFASSDGGLIVVGIVDRTNEVVGVDDVEVEQGRIQGWIAEKVYPLPPYRISLATAEGKPLLMIHVERGSEPVYWWGHRPYYRNAAESRPMPPHEAARRYMRANVIARIEATEKRLFESDPSRHVAAGILAQGDLATMNYVPLRKRLTNDPDFLQGLSPERVPQPCPSKMGDDIRRATRAVLMKIQRLWRGPLGRESGSTLR
ncbi:MAG: hypothetical protein A2623_14365 [Caulobacterales bacterium RIFCSPHIGHO2_01_FULL_70_19]|nr:MAG: hypothetical protein A2623_14365 [Caulobacterales bacterium RIFCSPHIGHO2_01_FULL_70_19]